VIATPSQFFRRAVQNPSIPELSGEIESMDHNHDGQGGAIGDGRKIGSMQLALLHGGEILRDMLRNIAGRVEVPIANSFPIVVFNPLGRPRLSWGEVTGAA
jgi:hypothetical protein